MPNSNSPKLYIGLFIALVIGFLSYCDFSAKKGHTENLPFRNTNDTVAYAGMQQCRSCHQDIYNTYIQTGMGQSFGLATKAKSAADYEHALVYDTLNDFYYHPYWENDTLYFEEFRLSDKGDTIHKRTEGISYVIGSGQHTNSHLINRDGYIYQAPITFYTQKGQWDLAPGFEGGHNSRFDRIIGKECMTCHNGLPDMEEKSLNKYHNVKMGIDCERCHGPGALHVKEKLAGIKVDTTETGDWSIVNPKRLSKERQMSVCQRCHLQGLSVLKEGKDFDDFLPSMHLKEVFSVFLPRFENADDQFIMASQAERLSMSECYKMSEMTCISCHNPHESVRVTPISTFNEKCGNCHGTNKKQETCTLPMAERGDNNCSGCHMPKSGSIDIPHVSITDHWIRKNPEKTRSEPKDFDELAAVQKFIGLHSYNNTNPDVYTRAKAYLSFYEKFSERSMFLDSAANYFSEINSKDQLLSLEIHRDYLLGNWNQISDRTAQLNWDKIYDKSWTAYRIGEAHFNLGNYQSALEHFEIALEEKALNLDFLNKKGAALFQLKMYDEAFKVFLKIVNEQAAHKEAQANLGWIYLMRKDYSLAQKHLHKAIDLDPDYEKARLNLIYLYLSKENYSSAENELKKVLRINPDNQQAQDLLMKLKQL
ncbi:MAG: tetratricopeptide repeat protein [Chitinophagales bacterium]